MTWRVTKNNRAFRIDSDNLRIRMMGFYFSTHPHNASCRTDRRHKVINGSIHSGNNFTACPMIVRFPIQLIRILIDPVGIVILLQQRLHSLNTRD